MTYRRVALMLRAVLAIVLSTAGLTSPALAGQNPAGANQVEQPPSAPSVGAVFREMPLDLVRFISLDTVKVLSIGGGAAAIAHAWDDDLVTEIEESPTLNNALEPGSKYGAFAVMLSGSFVVYAAGRVSGHRHLAVVGADLVRGQVVSQLWVQAVKFTVQRERPDGSNQQSFPSGHAAGGLAMAAVLAHHYGWKAGVPAYIGAAYIAAARVHDNKHYLSDVTFGAAMGLAGARTVLRAGRYGVQVAPSVGPRRAAINVTLVPSQGR